MASCTQTSKPSMRVTMGSYRAVCKDVSVIQTVLGWARQIITAHRSSVSDILSAFFSTPFRSLPRPLLLLLYPSSSPSCPHSYSSSSPSFGSADCAPPTPPDSSVTLPPTAILQTETPQALPPSRLLLDRRLYLFYSVLSAVIAFLPLFIFLLRFLFSVRFDCRLWPSGLSCSDWPSATCICRIPATDPTSRRVLLPRPLKPLQAPLQRVRLD